MEHPSKNSNKRDIRQLLQTSMIIIKSSMRRLLFTKTTISLLVLCFIPILVFGLWVGGAFPEETEDLYENRVVNYDQLYNNQVVELQKSYPGFIIIKDEVNITIEISYAIFEPINPPTEQNFHTIYLSGTTDGNISFLNLSIFF